jgi:hypothetical protein
MFAKRLFLIPFVTVMVATVASAQSKHGWGNKTARRGAVTQTTEATTTKAGPQNGDDDDRSSLEGTWRATETFPDGTFRVLFTFGAGKNGNNGIVVHSDELFFVPSPSCLTSQGVWKRTGERRFIATDEGFCFDSSGQPPTFDPFGKIKFESAIRLNNQGTEFTGNMHIEAFDLDGNLVFSTDADLHGVRMRAEAPPN